MLLRSIAEKKFRVSISDKHKNKTYIMEERQDNNEKNVKDEKTLRSEWLLLLLSIIILILLLLLFLVAGINYYKMEKKGTFRVSGNTVYLGEGMQGEISEEFEAIIEDIDSLPSLEDIYGINDLNTIRSLIEKIRSILSEAEKLPEEEKAYFDAIYKNKLNELLDALLKRAKQLSDGLAPDENYTIAPYGPSEAETGGDSGKSHTKTDTGGSGGGSGKDKKEEPPQITVTPDDGSAGDKFSFAVDGSLYPGDSISRSYNIDLTYSGDRKLWISIPTEKIEEEAAGLSGLLDCEVKIDDEVIYPKAGGSHKKLRDMEAEYALPHADNTKKLSKKCSITVKVPKTLNDDLSQGNSYQGKKITDFTIKWQIR